MMLASCKNITALQQPIKVSPKTEEPNGSIEPEESFGIHVDFALLLDHINPLGSSLHAQDEFPHCDNVCNQDNCIYLIQVLSNGNEIVICETNSKNGESVYFNIFNKKLLKDSTLKVSTSKDSADLSNKDYNSVDEMPYSTVFNINDEDMKISNKVVVSKRSDFITNEFNLVDDENSFIDSLVTPQSITEAIYFNVSNDTNYTYKEQDFFNIYFKHKELFKDLSAKKAIKKIINKGGKNSPILDQEEALSYLKTSTSLISMSKESYDQIESDTMLSDKSPVGDEEDDGITYETPVTESADVLTTEAPADSSLDENKDIDKDCKFLKVLEKNPSKNTKLLEKCQIQR